MTPAAQTLVAEIGRDLKSAGDALYEARIKFGELRRLLHGGAVVVDAEFHDPTVDAAAPASAPAPAPRHAPLPLLKREAARKPGPTGQYTFNGVAGYSARALAEMAGCKLQAMQYRLAVMGLTPEAAVAAGARMENPNKGNKPRYEFRGQMLTAAELAAIAGCAPGAMHNRLTISRVTPEEAVAAGARMPRRPRQMQAKAKASARDAGVAPPAPPTRAPSVFEVKLDRSAEAVIPPNVKRTVAPALPDRFAPVVVPSTFGRIGSYERTGSALERALEGKT